MTQKYITLSEEALTKMCSLIRDSHSIADAIDDENIASNSTYSSLKIQELLEEIDDVNIVTTLDENSTDNQVPSAKTMYEKLKHVDEEILTEYATTSDLANYLPLTGGTVRKNDVFPLAIQNTQGANTYLQYAGNSGNLGSIGFIGADNPVFIDKTSSVSKKLIHEGNMATHFDNYVESKYEGYEILEFTTYVPAPNNIIIAYKAPSMFNGNNASSYELIVLDRTNTVVGKGVVKVTIQQYVNLAELIWEKEFTGISLQINNAQQIAGWKTMFSIGANSASLEIVSGTKSGSTITPTDVNTYIGLQNLILMLNFASKYTLLMKKLS